MTSERVRSVGGMPSRIRSVPFLACYHPHSHGCKGNLRLEAHRWEHDPTTYALVCHSCARRMPPLLGTIDSYLKQVSSNPEYDRYQMEQGYLPGSYLRWLGYSGFLLRKALKGGTPYVPALPATPEAMADAG